jgi:hypothetical protein
MFKACINFGEPDWRPENRMQMRLITGEMGDTRVPTKLASFISVSSNCGGAQRLKKKIRIWGKGRRRN